IVHPFPPHGGPQFAGDHRADEFGSEVREGEDTGKSEHDGEDAAAGGQIVRLAEADGGHGDGGHVEAVEVRPVFAFDGAITDGADEKQYGGEAEGDEEPPRDVGANPADAESAGGEGAKPDAVAQSHPLPSSRARASRQRSSRACLRFGDSNRSAVSIVSRVDWT